MTLRVPATIPGAASGPMPTDEQMMMAAAIVAEQAKERFEQERPDLDVETEDDTARREMQEHNERLSGAETQASGGRQMLEDRKRGR